MSGWPTTSSGGASRTGSVGPSQEPLDVAGERVLAPPNVVETGQDCFEQANDLLIDGRTWAGRQDYRLLLVSLLCGRGDECRSLAPSYSNLYSY